MKTLKDGWYVISKAYTFTRSGTENHSQKYRASKTWFLYELLFLQIICYIVSEADPQKNWKKRQVDMLGCKYMEWNVWNF